MIKQGFDRMMSHAIVFTATLAFALAFALAMCALAAARPMTAPSTSPAEPRPMRSFAELDKRAAAGEPMSVVFFGGSLTWGANASDPQRTSYRGLMGEYLQKRYPKCPVTLHDAAIGGTGSQLGIFRIDRDVLAYKPDLVFLDFTLNDGLMSSDTQSLDSYETIVRTLVSNNIAVELVFLGGKGEFGPGYHPDKVTRVLAHKKLAAAYGTAVGDIYPTVQKAIESGKFTREELWPFEGTHPDDNGYHLYFEAVRDGYEQAVSDGRTCKLPESPVFGDSYLNRQRIRLADSPLPAGWQRAKTYRTAAWFDGLSSRWMGDVAMCDVKAHTPIEPLTVEFTGTLVGLFGEADADGLSFQATIDGKPLMYKGGKNDPPTETWPFHSPRPANLFMWRVLATDLPPGKHTLMLKPIVPPDAKAGQLRIESVCAAGQQ